MAVVAGPYTFTGADTTAAPGAPWAVGAGAGGWEISSNQLTCVTEYGVQILYYNDTIDGDQYIEVDINGRASDGGMGIGLRYLSADGSTMNAGIECYVGSDGSGGLYYGSGSTLDTFAAASFPFTLRLEVEGLEVSLLRDDVEVASGTLPGGYRSTGSPFLYMNDTWQHPDNLYDNLELGDFSGGGEDPVAVPYVGILAAGVI